MIAGFVISPREMPYWISICMPAIPRLTTSR